MAVELPVEELAPVFASIKAGEEPAWLVLSIDPEKKTKINLTGVGRCGLRHLKRYLNEDQVQWGVFRYTAIAGAVRQVRFVFFTWRGPSAPLKAKMAAQNARAPVQAFFDGCQENIEFSSMEEIEEGAVFAKLNSLRGAMSKAEKAEFGTGNDADLEFDEEAIENERKRKEEEEARIAKEAEEARLAAEAAEAERLRLIEEERQRKLKLLPPRSEAKPKRLAREGAIDGVDISSLTAIYAAESLADVEEEIAWVLCQASEENHNKVDVVATGSGGLDELAAKLSDNDIQFGAFRAAAIERKGQKLSIRSRLVTFWWSGPGVTTKTKRDNTELRGALSKYFEAPVLELRVNGDKADFTEERVVPQLKKHVVASEWRFGQYTRESQADDYIKQLQELSISGGSGAGATAE